MSKESFLFPRTMPRSCPAEASTELWLSFPFSSSSGCCISIPKILWGTWLAVPLELHLPLRCFHNVVNAEQHLLENPRWRSEIRNPTHITRSRLPWVERQLGQKLSGAKNLSFSDFKGRLHLGTEQSQLGDWKGIMVGLLECVIRQVCETDIHRIGHWGPHRQGI